VIGGAERAGHMIGDALRASVSLEAMPI